MASPTVPSPKGMTTAQWLAILELILPIALATAQASGASPEIIGEIQAGIDAVFSGLNAIKQAQQIVDPNALQPITPIP